MPGSRYSTYAAATLRSAKSGAQATVRWTRRALTGARAPRMERLRERASGLVSQVVRRAHVPARASAFAPQLDKARHFVETHGGGMALLGISACLGLSMGTGRVAPLHALTWAAAAACAVWMIGLQRRQLRAVAALRGQVAALEAASRKPRAIDVVDVEVLDEGALVATRERYLALLSQVEEELELRQTYAFAEPPALPSRRVAT